MISAITPVLQTQTADKLLAAFLAPGTGFMEDEFSSEGGGTQVVSILFS